MLAYVHGIETSVSSCARSSFYFLIFLIQDTQVHNIQTHVYK